MCTRNRAETGRQINTFNNVFLDDILEKNIAVGDPRSFLSVHSWPLIIDEAQKAPELFPELERTINEERSTKGNKASAGMFILSGSTSLELIDRAEESLAGRIGIIEMSPLSINEIAKRSNQPFLINSTSVSQQKTEK